MFITADVRSFYHWYSIVCIKTLLIYNIHIMHIKGNIHTCMDVCVSVFVCAYVCVCAYIHCECVCVCVCISYNAA